MKHAEVDFVVLVLLVLFYIVLPLVIVLIGLVPIVLGVMKSFAMARALLMTNEVEPTAWLMTSSSWGW